MKKRIFLVMAVLVIAATTQAATVSAQTNRPADVAKCYSSKTAAPKKGDSITLTWGALQEGLFKKYVIPLFKKDTGIDVKWVSNSSDVAAARIIAAGGGSEFDVAFMSPANIDTLRDAKLLEKLDYSKMPEMANIPKDERDTTPEFSNSINAIQFANGLSYAPEYFEKRGLPEPTTLMDMFSPVYKDVRIGLYQPPFGTATTMIAAINKMVGGKPNDVTPGINKLATLKDRAWPMVNNTQLAQAVAQGRIGMWWDALPTTWQAWAAGLKVKAVFSPYAWMSAVFGTIPKNPKNGGAACVFLNWLSSVRGQNEMMKVNDVYVSAKPGVKANRGVIIDMTRGAKKFSLPGLMKTLPSTSSITTEWNRAFR